MKLMGKKTTTDNFELMRTGKHLLGDKFAGVYSSDQRPALSKKKPYAILNTKPTSSGGEHWVALARMPSTGKIKRVRAKVVDSFFCQTFEAYSRELDFAAPRSVVEYRNQISHRIDAINQIGLLDIVPDPNTRTRHVSRRTDMICSRLGLRRPIFVDVFPQHEIRQNAIETNHELLQLVKMTESPVEFDPLLRHLKAPHTASARPAVACAQPHTQPGRLSPTAPVRVPHRRNGCHRAGMQ